MIPQSFKRYTLEISLESTPAAVHLRWVGAVSDMDPSGFLDPILNTALNGATEENVPLELDMRALKFINSAAIACVARLLASAQEHGRRVILVHNGRSGSPLSALASADGLVEVRVDSSGES